MPLLNFECTNMDKSWIPKDIDQGIEKHNGHERNILPTPRSTYGFIDSPSSDSFVSIC